MMGNMKTTHWRTKTMHTRLDVHLLKTHLICFANGKNSWLISKLPMNCLVWLSSSQATWLVSVFDWYTEGRVGDFCEKHRRCMHHTKMILDPRVSCFLCLLHVHFPFVIQLQKDGVALNSHISIILLPSNPHKNGDVGVSGLLITWIGKSGKSHPDFIFMFVASLFTGMSELPHAQAAVSACHYWHSESKKALFLFLISWLGLCPS